MASRKEVRNGWVHQAQEWKVGTHDTIHYEIDYTFNELQQC